MDETGPTELNELVPGPNTINITPQVAIDAQIARDEAEAYAAAAATSASAAATSADAALASQTAAAASAAAADASADEADLSETAAAASATAADLARVGAETAFAATLALNPFDQPVEVLHPVTFALPSGWWDTGLRIAMAATSPFTSTTSYLAIISNWGGTHLFGAGQGGANFDFDNLSRLFQSDGVTVVSAPGQSLALAVDDHRGLITGAELKANGVIGLTGVATAATYNTGTGVGSISRAVGIGNQSWVRLLTGGTPGEQYIIDITTPPTGILTLRHSGNTATVLLQLDTGTRRRYLVAVPASGEIFVILATDSVTASFTVHSFAKLALPLIYQANNSLRPVTGKAPLSVRNQLTNTENFPAALWAGYYAKPALTTAIPSISLVAVTNRLTYDPALGGGSGREMGLFHNGGPWVAGNYVISFLMRCNDRIPDGIGVGQGNSANQSVYIDDVLVFVGGPVSNVNLYSFLTLGQVHRIRIHLTLAVTAPGPRIFELRINDLSAGKSVCTIDIAEPQSERGLVLTNHQRVGASSLDITEAGVPSFGFVRHDKADDTYPIYCPAAITGHVVILSRQGSWIEPINVSANGLLTLGPYSTPGQPGLLQALTDIVDILIYDRMPTAEEKARLMRKYRPKGVLGWLIEGPELIINGGFDDASNWNLNGLWTIGGGVATLGVGGGTEALAQPFVPINGAFYMVKYDLLSLTVGACSPRFFGGVASSGLSGTDTGPRSTVIIGGDGNTSFGFRAGGSTLECSIDNVSLKLLTPETAP